jgi:hypothetical protein
MRAPSWPKAEVRSHVLAIVLAALATPAYGQSRELVGYAGVLGEWELTATLTESTSWLSREYSGPLTMRHVGYCTQDGPEEKTGQIRLEISTLTSRLSATVSVDGRACSYRGRLSESYTGTMNCPDRPPVPLELWLK